jgi:Zn finger protein HypA/HybF involved in hydrogenase expression
MKQHQIVFRCDKCKAEVKYKTTYSCPKCGKYHGWEYVNKVYEDAYIEIYEVGV